MAAGQMPMKILVPAGVGGAALLLYARYQQTGHLRLLDWLIAGSILVMSILILLASRPRATAWQDSAEESPPMVGHPKWLLGMLLLPLLLWVMYSASDDFQDVLKKPDERGQAAKALVNATKDPRMIRTQAGEPYGTGWIPVHSTAGGFSVYVPERFNEAISTLEMNGRPTPVVVVGSRMGDWKFVALAAQWTGGKRNLKARARDAVKSLSGFKNTIVSREGMFEDKYPLIEIEMSSGEARGLAWVIATDKTVYGLAVEGPELTDSVRDAARRFFNSFAIVASEPHVLANPAGAESGEPDQ